MTQQPPGPPPGMTGFTVSDGFSVIPPKRPVTVTIAVVMMFVVAGLALVGGFTLIVEDLLYSTDGLGFVVHEEFLRGLTLIVVAVATTVFAMLVRGAATGAHNATFTLLGGAAILFLATGFSGIATLPFPGSGSGTSLLANLVVLLGFIVTAAPVALLASPEAARWFRDRRREVTFIDQPTAASRPLAFTVGIAFLTLTGLLEIGSVAAYLGSLTSQGADVAGASSGLFGYLLSVGLPILLLLVTTAGLTLGSDLARVAAYGVSGYYCFNGVSLAVGVFLADTAPDIGWIYFLDLALGLAAAIAAAIALAALCQRQLVHWFDSRLTPSPPATA